MDVVKTPKNPNHEVKSVADLLDFLSEYRFSGRLIKCGPNFGFIQLKDTDLEVFVHREMYDDDWNTVKTGDLVKLSIRKSKTYQYRLCAKRVRLDEHQIQKR